MSSLSSILEIARRSLTAQRLAINTTGHNIANAGTIGYSRQRVSLSPTDAMKTPFGFVGTGVISNHIGRIRLEYIDQQIRSASDSLGSAAAEQKALSQVEAILNEPAENGLNGTMNQFFTAFNDLALHPEESAYRSNVLQKATLMTQTMRQLHLNLTRLRNDMLDDINAKVNEINRLTSEIGGLDLQILNARTAGKEPSDMLDQRDVKLDELSRLTKLTASADINGSMIVSIGGAEVASRGHSTPLTTTIENGQVAIHPGDSASEITYISGELGGDLKMYNETIPGYLSRIDQLAQTMITQFNALHSTGYGLGNPPSTGNAFFTGGGAANIAIDPTVLANPGLIASSSDGRPGNNDIARALADMKDTPFMDGGLTSLPQFYTNLVSEIGSEINRADYQLKTQTLIVTQLEDQRNSVSGVSIDEEMTNLVQFQRAFDAAARMVTVVDEMMQTIISLK